MDIYIKPAKKISVAGSEHKTVYVRDIAEIIAPPELLQRIKNIKIFEPESNRKKSYLISVIDIIGAIDRALPGHTINNVGETDTILEYSPKKDRDSALWRWVKVAFVSCILVAGSATAIMSFHSDAQLPEIFRNFYYIFFGEKIEHPKIIEIPYSIGVAAGIIIFFNHFAGKKITSDPTPIEVEISMYESDVSDTVIDVLNTERSSSKKNAGQGDL